jgi:hypothetical protein
MIEEPWMPDARRDVTVADIAAIQALLGADPDPNAAFKAVEALAAETVGFVFLTTLRVNQAEACVERLHSSDAAAYPVGGRKPLSTNSASHAALDAGEVVLLPDRAAIRAAFFDHELIFSLGSTAIMNAPIRHAGRRLGLLNFCGVENGYGPDEIRKAQLLAGLLAATLLTMG